MNIFDIGLILLFIMFTIVGFKNGVIRELVSLVGIVIIFLVSFYLKGIVGNFLALILPFIKFKGAIEGITALNILFYQAVAFVIIFCLLLSLYAIALTISKVLQKLVNLTIVLWLPSKLLGAVVGFINGIVVLFVISLILMIPLKNQEIYYESTVINTLLYKTPILSDCSTNFTNAIDEIYTLGNQVSNKEITSTTANQNTVDIMLKYNIVDKKTIERLITFKKLDNIGNINYILNKY